jgi:hypothetical protein
LKCPAIIIVIITTIIAFSEREKTPKNQIMKVTLSIKINLASIIIKLSHLIDNSFEDDYKRQRTSGEEASIQSIEDELETTLCRLGESNEPNMARVE